ncbi:phospholipase B1, membrane-associated [Diachasma alloeum]|uniref:phospholipase B1, membrane-associated n=1 Tax=Diachasma alloeum TaxID=454923 RepID=UPI0007380FB7|nr:phospholipase B1, membrane-associated [Diachasma alloeum]
MSKLPLTVILLLISCTSLVTTQRTFLDNPYGVYLIRSLRNWMTNSIGSTGDQHGDLYRAAQKQGKVQDPIPESVPFPCNITAGRSETVPTSVHKLRPGDIDVIGAMGDSLTAGFGIYGSDMITIFIENRGASSLGGGQGSWRDTLTIPNILKAFNPKLFGYCKKDAWNHQPAAEFNVAESASMSRDMPFMAEILARRMKSDPRVDMKNHWKLVSLFNGANDFCSDMCWNPSASDTIENHRRDLIKTLRTLRDNLPRTLVSVVSTPHIKPLVDQKGRSTLCQLTYAAECSCLSGRDWQHRRQEFYDIMWSFQQVDEEVAAYPEFQREDFSVVAQPLFVNYTWPTLPDGTADFRYMSADCFHFSQLGNERMTYSVWRNMLEPVGRKSHFWTDVGTLPCPTEDRPYIATLGNS